MNNHKKLVFVIAIGLVFVLPITISSCNIQKPSNMETTPVNQNALFTQVASTVLAGITQTAQMVATPMPDFTSTPEPTITAEATITPTENSSPSFINGTWRVGVDIQPGTYRTEGANSCYWERLSGFTGSLGDIITNANPDGPAIVTILPSDVGFMTDGCGVWILQ